MTRFLENHGILEADTLAPASVDPTADYEVIYDASGVATKKRLAVPNGNVVAQGAGALTLTKATHGGRTILHDAAAGSTMTLWDADGSGLSVEVIVKTTITSNGVIIQAPDANNVITGHALLLQDGGDTVVGFATAATSDTITLNGTTTGGIAGARVMLRDIGTDLWFAQVISDASGSEATPFSAAVS